MSRYINFKAMMPELKQHLICTIERENQISVSVDLEKATLEPKYLHRYAISVLDGWEDDDPNWLRSEKNELCENGVPCTNRQELLVWIYRFEQQFDYYK